MKKQECQYKNETILTDKSRRKERPWREMKNQNQKLADIMENIDERKALRLRDCATRLVFTQDEKEQKRLKSANFCRIRLCPMCQWRRSLKTFVHMKKIIQAIENDRKRAYVMVTFTVKNCTDEDLSITIDKMMKAYNLMMKRDRVKKSIKGWYRGLEITHDMELVITREMWRGDRERHIRSKKVYYEKLGLHIGDQNPNFNYYHPHFHCVFVVNRKYFHSSQYITKDEFTQIWKECLSVEYTPQVDVRRITSNALSGVAEVAKYTVKADDYINTNKWELSQQTVRTLMGSLSHRRLVAYGGICKYWHHKLNLDDDVEGDLTHIEGEMSEESKAALEMVYIWHTGYNQYILDRG